MSGFDPTWLDLREPADAAARDLGLLAKFARAVDAAPDAMILDIGCGTGSTRRNVVPHLSRPRLWHLADYDTALLDLAKTRGKDEVQTVQLDLNTEGLPLEQGGFVTASALFDLCSQQFIERVIAQILQHDASLYAALNYDGRIDWHVPHPLDNAVVSAFNAHQQGDKGFGPALGPRAGAALAKACRMAGLEVTTADSPWALDGMPDLQSAFLAGIVNAVAETQTVAGLDNWHRFRIDHGSCMVGHLDVLALHRTG